MKIIFAAIIMGFVVMGGCAHLADGSSADDRETALSECREEADMKYRARYTTEWDAYVEECMDKKGF